jgi:hypothetical protein
MNKKQAQKDDIFCPNTSPLQMNEFQSSPLANLLTEWQCKLQMLTDGLKELVLQIQPNFVRLTLNYIT